MALLVVARAQLVVVNLPLQATLARLMETVVETTIYPLLVPASLVVLKHLSMALHAMPLAHAYFLASAQQLEDHLLLLDL